MSVIGIEVLKNTNLEKIEKAFGRPNVQEYAVDYINLDKKRYAQFFVHHSDGRPITIQENINLQLWLEKLTQQGNLERLQKLGEQENVRL
tara:strand:- start:7356 stop:7625 length:270 start_codon:yes stop_codon:yes gene_type:complete